MLERLNLIRPLFSRQDKLKYLGLLVMMILGAFLDVVGIGAVPAFVATLAVPEKVMAIPAAASILEALDITTGRELVLWGAGLLIVVFLFKNLYLYGVYYLQVQVTEFHRVRLADRLFRAYLRAPWEFHLNRNTAELLRNITTETKEIMTGVINPLLTLTMAGMMTLFTVVLLLVTTPGIAVVGIALVGGASWGFLRIFKHRLQHYGIEAKHERKEVIKAVTQGLSALVDMRVLGRERYFEQVFHRSVANFARVMRLHQVIRQASPNVLEMVAVVGLLGIVMVLVLVGTDAASLVPMLALYGAAIVRLRQSIGQMVGSISQIQFSGAAIPHIVEDLQRLEGPSWKRQKKQPPPPPLAFERVIRVEDVTYTYPDAGRPALHGVTLEVRKGESVAFVGSTGSGKSTLVNVILGLLRPQQGRVTVDGVDIHDNLRGWLDHVGYVPQVIVLLDDTLRRNVAFGIPDGEIDDAKVWAALEAAQLADFVRSLPEGLDTVTGERGVRLSGGQRQRVGLARALYHNPDVLVLDEATAALDNQTERRVMETIESLKRDRTVLMIAHRLSTVQRCDRLYFLKDGRIDATGTFDELAASHPEFQQMAEVV
ncbi:ABC transporter ATP-binding protein/permease [Rhodocaloribacter litoris]|uniref:ABC transporter ATP-binding protein n=1 Tax=Rhodocaloribacter litoris TaxID=2558931 RepID=UPI00141F85AA|nr:ABC transporter ATP-binding protein [Rhodocaloribacter litoris]QXD16215.1 ABC transporter ATP-binding protein/permease [Rhodocaloribacter litoris]